MTNPAVTVPREMLERCCYNIAYAVFNLAGRKLDDLKPGLIETSDPADSALIAEREIRAILAQPAAERDERAAFEAHYRLLDMSRDPISGAYYCSEVRSMWDAWQARAALASAQPTDKEQQP